MRAGLSLLAAAGAAALIAPAALSLAGSNAASDDTVSAIEDQSVAIALSVLLSNDDLTDATFERVSQPSNGFVYFDQLFDAIMYFPNRDFQGTDSFTYSITNGESTATATVTVEVSPTQDRPTSANDALAGTEDTELTFSTLDLFSNDDDIDGDTLQLAAFTQPFFGSLTFDAPTQTFTYVPHANYAGTDTFIYTVSDGVADDSALVTITLAEAEDPPTAVDDVASGLNIAPLEIPIVDLLANDLDVDGDTLTFVSHTSPSSGALVHDVGAATLTYTTTQAFAGTDSFDYTITDGQQSSTATVTVTILNGNHAPTAAPDAATAVEDTTVTFRTEEFLANDSDPDGDELTIVAVQDGTGGSVTTNGIEISFTPSPDFFGDANFSYTATDPFGASAQGTVTVTVSGADDAVLAGDDTVSVRIDTETGLLVTGNDSIVDGLSVLVVSPSAHGTVTETSPNSYSYTPDPGATGEYELTYTVADIDGDTSSGTIRLLVGFPDIIVADNAQLNNARSLYGTSVSGDAWLLAEPTWTTDELESVTFRLDGLPYGSAAVNNPFAPLVNIGVIQPIDTTLLANGVHTFTAEYETDAGLSYSYLLPFLVSNP